MTRPATVRFNSVHLMKHILQYCSIEFYILRFSRCHCRRCSFCLSVCFFHFPQCNVSAGVCVAEGMRLRGRDLEDSTSSWIPSVLGVQSVRLRLRLDRRTDKGRSLWQLVDLNGEAVPSGQGLWDRTPPTCSQSKNGVITSL